MDSSSEIGGGGGSYKLHNNNEEDELDLRRGPWTVDEDLTLINHIATHGEGRWNSLARSAGLKRTGKSCRLRWLNYLRPDVRRYGNRWSKIETYLPGRTGNEIKNYWRTRVQNHAKRLKCDVNSTQFKDTMRYLWMPRLVERIQASAASSSSSPASISPPLPATSPPPNHNNNNSQFITESSNYTAASSDSLGSTQVSDFSDYYYYAEEDLACVVVSISSSSESEEVDS